jgi:hypothetical protein
VSASFESRRAAVIAFLSEHDAGTTPHLFGDLLTHLIGVERLVRDWGGDDLLALIALGHATYGTDGFEPHILGIDDRRVLADVIGGRAEELVYLYASCDRGAFYPQLEDQRTAPGELLLRDRFSGAARHLTTDEVTLFVDLTYANEAELAASSPDGPSGWTWLADFCRRTRRWASPGFFAGAGALLGLDD